ncbi:hypothetical protein [Cellulomonas sp. Leaf334]|uniref:hypothetical protein n=1 Tax=Cellulomonas sp. Leaf334 TaxID=1736339 RepID=UPI0006F5273D|nr:hypothetical protein [Cellulomonas sp. Leaf334]KQR15978.1 hypothetical protein ASF78_00580 [Cellulomonas sp. Leaf334]
MWALLFRRVRLMVVVVVLLPVVASLARRLAERVERQQEHPTFGSRGLRIVESTATRARSFLR